MRFSTESHNRSHSKSALSEFLTLKMVPEGSPGCLGRPPGATLGFSWALLGSSWVALRRSWASKFSRSFQKCSKKLEICSLGGSWVALGSPPGDLSSIFDPPRSDFVPPGGNLEAFPLPNSPKVLAKSWRSLGENHSKHSEQPKRMNGETRSKLSEQPKRMNSK